jgi:hypothetical protein
MAAGSSAAQSDHGDRRIGGPTEGNGDLRETAGQAGPEPRPAAVAFVTTEHFTLQGARSQTISESAGRATMFLSSVTGGLAALGLVATATHVGAAFYAFGLILLPTLTFLGLVTFDRALQSGIEDHRYARGPGSGPWQLGGCPAWSSRLMQGPGRVVRR